MKQKTVLVEVDNNGDAIRIFRNVKDTFKYPVESVAEMSRSLAVGIIRRKVFERANCTPAKPGECEWCGRTIYWQSGSWMSGEMHEVKHRGKGGEISVENSVAICRNCHNGPTGAHGSRRWHSAKIRSSSD